MTAVDEAVVEGEGGGGTEMPLGSFMVTFPVFQGDIRDDTNVG